MTEHNMSPNERDFDGATTIHFAAGRGHPAVSYTSARLRTKNPLQHCCSSAVPVASCINGTSGTREWNCWHEEGVKKLLGESKPCKGRVQTKIPDVP